MPHSLAWFTWGDRAFDIRYLRETVGLPPLSANDPISLPSRSAIDPLFALEAVFAKAGTSSFRDLLDAHDRRLPRGVRPPVFPVLQAA